MIAMDELGTTARLLEVLSLLQARPQWSGPELADRLGVTVRTVRRDIDRLRQLGYPVLAATGVAGGYRLGAGGRTMPPLMLDRDEAVAVAVCLRSTATETIAGGGEAAIRALGKLDQLLPPTLRRQVGTIGSMTTRLGAPGAPVAPDVLVTITRACRDSERLRVRYRDGRGTETDRTLDPYRVVSTARRWYLVARDRERDDWRTFRVDRMTAVEPTGHRVELDDPPDPVAFVQAAITIEPYRQRARVELDAPLDRDRRAGAADGRRARGDRRPAHDADDRCRHPRPAHPPPAPARRRLPDPRDGRATRPRRRRGAAPRRRRRRPTRRPPARPAGVD